MTTPDPNNASVKMTLVPIMFILGTVGLVFGLIIHLIEDRPVSSPGIVSLVFGIISLPIIWALLPNLTNITSLKVGPSGFVLQRLQEVEHKTETVRETADETSRNVAKFIFLAMPRPTYKNLKKISGYDAPTFGRFRMNDGFKGELRYLRDNGYITLSKPIRELPEAGEDFSEYAQPTDIGEEFVRLREEYAPKNRRTRVLQQHSTLDEPQIAASDDALEANES
jgi:hypothetical protein